MRARVQCSAFDPEAVTGAFCADRRDVGAVASFIGRCRESTDERGVEELFLDHYAGFTERALARIAAQAFERFDLLEVEIVHRAGSIKPGEAIVLVLAAAAHRKAALDAVAFMMDHLKTDAPFWKRERGADGERWIEPRASDLEARADWE